MNAEQIECTEDDYLADTKAITSSMAREFDESSRVYAGRYVFRDGTKRPDTEAFRVGRMLHCALLEPARFAEQYVVAPKVDRRTKGGKAEYAFWLESQKPGAVPCDPDEHTLVLRMAESVMSNKRAAMLLGCDGEAEHTVQWRHEKTGLLLKARRDKRAPGLILDIKSTRDPSPKGFHKSVINYGYHRQGAWYLDSEYEWTGENVGFGLLAVRNEWPYEVALHEVSDELIQIGRRMNEATLERIARCFEENDWRNEWEREIQFVDPPLWMQKQYEEAAQ